MSFPRYPTYKDSGVAWLGEVPGHWGIGQSRRLFALRNERALALDRQLTASQEHGVIYQDDFVRLQGRRVVEVIKGTDILKHVEPNDFVISMRSFQGGIEWCNVRGCISSAYVMLVPCDRVHGPFFSYLLKSRSYIQALQTTSNLVRDGQALRYDNFTQVDLPLVPLDEQTQIAAFLDRETAKIDALVAEQRRLMDLLKEKRQAVISHAVTRGLNPDAPLKPSGVEWLGEVPAHWEVLPVKFVTRIGNGSTPSRENPDYWKDGDYPWLSSTVVNLDCVIEAEEFVTMLALEECHLPQIIPPAVLIGITGQGRTRGMATTLLVEATINQHVAFLKPNQARLDVFFLRRIFDMAYPYLRRDSEAGGSTKGAITCAQIGNFKVAVPPLDEQVEIVSRTAQLSMEFDALTTEAQRAIDLLQERRTALISAAVTGQIDVRDAVAAGG
jgi:type I restriction enzyme S subunit